MASFYDHWGYERYRIFTNSLGFKDSTNRVVKFKNKNILFIGDSFTEGVGIKYEDTYVGLIDSNLKSKNNNIEVLNAGVQSYSTSIYLSKLYHLLERKKLPITDVVVMISGGEIFDDYYKYLDLNEDFILNHVDQKNKYIIKIINFLKSNTLTYQLITKITPSKNCPGGSLFSKKVLETNYDKREINLFSISNNEIDQMPFLIIMLIYIRQDEFKIYWGKKAIDKSLNNLKQITKITLEKNIKLNIFYLYEPVILLREPNKIYFDYLINGLEKLKTKNVNIEFIRKKEYENAYDAYKNLFFINDIHWNKRGNAKVAKEILNKIELN